MRMQAVAFAGVELVVRWGEVRKRRQWGRSGPAMEEGARVHVLLSKPLGNQRQPSNVETAQKEGNFVRNHYPVRQTSWKTWSA